MFGFRQPVSYKIFGEVYSVLGPLTEEVTEGLSKLLDEEGHNLCYSLNTAVVIESARKILRCVARIAEMRNACRILIIELRKLINLEYFKRTSKTNIELGIIGDLIARFVTIQYIGIWCNAVVGTLTDTHAPHTAGIMSSRLVTSSFLRNVLQILSTLNGCLKRIKC
jgi:hypothetical protein